MPIIRKIVRVGNSALVSLPARWLEWFKRKYGTEPQEVAIEVNEQLTIRPILPDK